MLSQRQLYARSRMSRAVDRQIQAKDSSEKERASRWVLAWAAQAGHAAALHIFRPHGVAGTLGRDHDDVDVGARLD